MTNCLGSKTHFVLFLFLFTLFGASAQGDHAILWLKDKQSDQNWDPSAHFSPRSIEKRLHAGQRWDQLDLPVNPRYIDQVKAEGVAILGVSRWHNAILIKGEALAFYSMDFIDYVQELPGNFTKNDRVAAVLPGGKKTGITMDQVRDFLEVPEGLGAGTYIAVFDAGYLGVDSLTAFQSMNVKHQYNFVSQNDSVYGLHDHGTLVLSMLAARDDNGIVNGLAPEADYALFITENVESERLIEEFYWSLAAEECDSLGVDVINSSLSYTEFDDVAESHDFDELNGNTTLVARSANIASKKNMVVVVSAGNLGETEWKRIGSPADASGALAVGAISEKFKTAPRPASFSGYGPNAAYEKKPEISAPGEALPYFAPNGAVLYGNGTSFSAPIISGAIASLLSSKGAWSGKFEDLKLALVQSASNYPVYGEQLGYGWPNFTGALDILENGAQEGKFSVFPVPAKGQFSIFPRADKVSLFDAKFQELELEKSELDHIYSTPYDLSTGVYLLKIERAGEVFIQTLMLD